MFMSILPACIPCILCVHFPQRSEDAALELEVQALELEVQMVISHYVSTGNWTHVFYKSNKWCQLMSPASFFFLLKLQFPSAS